MPWFRLVAWIPLLWLLAPLSGAQAAGDPLEGDWWVSIRGKDRGAASLTFTDAGAGTFTVSGFGALLDPASLFRVSAGQSVQKTSAGGISGTVALEDPSGTPLGSLQITKGKVNSSGARLKLRGTVMPAAGGELRAKLRGVRFPKTFPVLTGRDRETQVRGKGVRSKAFDLTVLEDDANPFPSFDYSGNGPVEIDGVETPAVDVLGTLVLDPREKVFGIFASPDLGNGTLTGRLRSGTSAPRANLKVQTARRFKLKGDLEEAVSPILSVTPTGTVDFGGVKVGQNTSKNLVVTNVGVGTLTGDATLSGSADFSIVSGTPYSLAASASQTLVVTFAPGAEGAATAQISFTGGGGAVRDLMGTGTSLTVQPAAGLAFGDVTVGGSGSTLTFTVTNDGTTSLTGTATVTSGKPDFELVDAGGSVLTEVTYTLAPAASQTLRVLFDPASTGAKTGTVTFTGGGGATRSLTGTGT